MKMPAIGLGRGGLAELLLQHAEKIAGGIVAMIVAILLWKAVAAVRLQGVQRSQTPEEIAQAVTQAEANVTREPNIPDDLLPAVAPLGAQIEPWRNAGSQDVAMVDLPLFDRPLFGEMAKREKPTALAIEDLRVTAGVAVVPDQQPANPGRGADLQPSVGGAFQGAAVRVKVTPYVIITGLVPTAKQTAEFRRCFSEAQFQDPQRDLPLWSSYKLERAAVGPSGVGRWENIPLTGVQRLGGGQGGGDMGMAAQFSTADGIPPSFLLEGGATEIAYAAPLPARVDEAWGAASLHPWFSERLRKALEEGMFDTVPADEIKETALKDLKKSPERFLGKTLMLMNVVLGAKPTRVREAGLFSYTVKDDGGTEVGNPKLGATRDLAVTTSEQFRNFLTVGDPAGEADSPCHLVVRIEQMGRTPVARVQEIRFLDDAGQVVDTQVEPSAGLLDTFGGGGVSGGYGMSEGFGGDMGGGMAFTSGDGGGMPGMRRPGFEYRLFRFVDMTAQTGRTYRYRVTLALRNPNFDLPGQYLTSVDHARSQYLLSNPSEPSPAVTVPETTSLLVGLLGPEDVKRLKVRPGMQEVLVLAPNETAGQPTLRGVLLDKGGVADVDGSLNRPSTTRSRGDDVKTGRALVDVVGQQSDRTGAASRRTQIAEPLEMLFLRPDGRYEVVSAADSERQLTKYRATLDGGDRAAAASDFEPSAESPTFPFGTPGRPSQ